jgi:hypothetical protein
MLFCIFVSLGLVEVDGKIDRSFMFSMIRERCNCEWNMH